MIEGNVIKFGYGDVIVSSRQEGRIIFEEIKNPVECGHQVTTREGYELYPFKSILIVEENRFELLCVLRGVSQENPVVHYRGYTFDFTNYNEKSLEVVLRNARNMVHPITPTKIRINLFSLAC